MPRTNPLRNESEITGFLADLLSPEGNTRNDAVKANHVVFPSKDILAATRKRFRHADDDELQDVVLRAQAHQMAALFIRKAREHAGLSTTKLAKLMGVSITQLSDAQSFKSIRKVSLDFLLRAAIACGRDLHLSPEQPPAPEHYGQKLKHTLKQLASEGRKAHHQK